MATLPITLIMAGVAAIMSLWLGIRVSRLRIRHKILVGDGDDPLVRARMRAHSNFSEYMPVFLILVASIELAGGDRLWLWAAAALFILARLAHPFGMDKTKPHPLRAAGATVTWAVLLGLGIWAIAIGYAELGRPDFVTYASAARAST